MGVTTVKLCNGLILVMVIFLPLEWFFALSRQRLFRKGFIRDFFYYFLNNLLPGLLLVVPITGVVWALHRFVPQGLHHWVAGLPSWARYASALLVAEIGTYWGHRWSHEIPFLWRFHAVHHGAEEMDWLVNTRAHPLDMVFTRTCAFIPLYVLGLAQPMGDNIDGLPLIVLLTSLWGYFIHANLRWRFGWLERLVTTPAFHHWHHTNDGPQVINKNYAALLPGVDRLFGTLHLPDTHPGKYGIDDPMPASLPGQMTQPFRWKRKQES
jgi:sterol desaturase/sphingolipid hydroxylase (fatty acid hydroxylase superfamily)